jgi:NAD(P)H-hydrate epimerase
MILQLRPLSRDEVRALDRQAADEFALPTLLLMENAGRGAAGWLAELTGAIPSQAGGRVFTPWPSPSQSANDENKKLPRIVIVCGPGNNGGDGGVVARHLNAWGFPVQVVWFVRADQLRGDAATQWSILSRSGIDQSAWFDDHPADAEQGPDPTRLSELFDAADWLVDALLGTGLSRPVEGPLRTVIERMNQSGRPIFALDLPSGLDADTGQPLGVAIRATATATFVAIKRGFDAPGADQYVGQVAVIDIGIPRRLLEPFLLKL